MRRASRSSVAQRGDLHYLSISTVSSSSASSRTSPRCATPRPAGAPHLLDAGARLEGRTRSGPLIAAPTVCFASWRRRWCSRSTASCAWELRDGARPGVALDAVPPRSSWTARSLGDSRWCWCCPAHASLLRAAPPTSRTKHLDAMGKLILVTGLVLTYFLHLRDLHLPLQRRAHREGVHCSGK